ncbi:hypothetical protein ACHWQZ_G013904 [Mnemiopsis leidyi]
MDRVTSDEPLYQAISKLDGFLTKKDGRRFSVSQSLFVLTASIFCGLATFSTLNSAKNVFHFERMDLVIICMGVSMTLGVLAALYRHARCTVSLMLPVLFSGLGRSLIRSIIISLIVSGPLQNIGDNAVLLAKSIECSAKLTVDQANETTQATVSALNDQMESIARATRSINENSRRVEEFADREMVKVFEREDKTGHLSPENMLKRASRQCHLNSDGPRKKCEIGINVDLEKCEKLKKQDDGCQNYDKKDLSNDNEKHTEDIKKSVSKFGEQYEDPRFSITSENKVEINNTMVTVGFKKLMSELNLVGSYISTFMNIVSLVLLCLVLVGAIQHQVKYLTELSYLNSVVTSQLLKLDASLPSQHRTFPLPIYMRDNNNCLPDGSPPDPERVLCICVFLFFVILLNFFQVYSQRSVRRICAWFYPERENRRVQFLYRFLKQRRTDCFKIIVEDRKGSLPKEPFLRKYFPRLIKKSCVICGDRTVHTTCLFCFGHGYEINFCWECWSDTEKKCPYCKTTQRLADTTQLSFDSDSSGAESDYENVQYNSLAYKIESELGDDEDDDGEDDEEQGRMVDIASSSSTYRKIMESFADSSSSSEDEEQEFNLLFKSMLSDSVSSNASIFTAKSSMSRPESVDKSNEHLFAVETSRNSINSLNSDLANTEQRISASSSKSFGRSNISDSTSKIRNLKSESSSSQTAGPSNLPQSETVGETKTGILYPLESGPALGRVALKRNRKQL